MRWMQSPALTIAVLHLAACMTWTRVPPSEVEPGDMVRVTTRDGRERQFEVKKVLSGALLGEDAWVRLDQVDRLERGRRTVLGHIGEGAHAALAVAAVLLIPVAIVAATPDDRMRMAAGFTSAAGP